MKLKIAVKILYAFSIALLVSQNHFAQRVSTEKSTASSANDLIAVRHPDLTNLETEVREQIISFQEALSKAAQESPTNAAKLGEAFGTMGRIYQAYSFFEAAANCYANASRLAPDDFRWVYLLAKIFEAQNKTNEAIEFYKRAETLRPDYLPIHVNLGDAYLQQNLTNEAKLAFENALKINPKSPSALYGLGQISYAQRDYETAISLFEKVLEIVPDAGRVHYSLALAFRGLKNIEKAKFHLAKQNAVGVRTADPLYDNLNDLKKGARLRILRGKQAFEAGRFAEAELEFQKALADEPENVSALINYGVTLVRLRKYPEAERHFEKAIAAEPRNSNAHYNLAVLLSLQKKHLEAISHLKKALEINPNDEQSRVFLAKELRGAGFSKEALNEYLAVYNADSENEDVLLELVKLLNENGKYKRAVNLLEKSYEQFPTRGRTAATLAYLLAASPQIELRDGKKALELAQRVYESTKLAEHGAIVAMAYAELGRCEDAARVIKETLDEAAKTGNQNLLLKLKNELNRYENEKPCRVKN